MLWRAQLRSTALALLTTALQGGGARVVSSKDTPAPDAALPSISIFVDDTKAFDYGSAPEARTTALISIEVECSGNTKDAAEALLDTLCEAVENTLFGTPEFVRLFEMIDSCETFTEYKGVNGKRHFAGATIDIKGHTHESWQPGVGADFSGLDIYVDSVNVFDPNGDYGGAEPFEIDNPPPRDKGPDGRPEIGATVDPT
jgi:hypothetical protein